MHQSFLKKRHWSIVKKNYYQNYAEPMSIPDLELYVRCSAGTSAVVTVSSSDTVLNLKKKVAAVFGTPPDDEEDVLAVLGVELTVEYDARALSAVSGLRNEASVDVLRKRACSTSCPVDDIYGGEGCG